MIRPKRQIRSELYISGDRAKAFFHLLREQKDAIEHELGYPLEWEELPNRRDCRISAYLNDVGPEDEKDWRRQHEWLASRLNDIHRVFATVSGRLMPIAGVATTALTRLSRAPNLSTLAPDNDRRKQSLVVSQGVKSDHGQ